MDPASTAILIRVAGELAASLIGVLRAGGKQDEAAAIELILKRSDDVWARVLAKAKTATGDD